MFLYENNFEQYLSIACSSSYLSVKPMGEVISRWLYVSKSESGTKDFFPKYALHSSLLRLFFFATSTYNLLLPSIFGTNVFMWQIVRMLWFISSCLLGTIYKSLTHKTKIWHNNPLSTEFGRYPFYFFCCFLEISAKTGVWLVEPLIMCFLRVMVCHILHTFFLP